MSGGERMVASPARKARRMTNPSTEELLRLAERCEAAKGPDRELDARIWCTLHGKRYTDHNPVYAAYAAENPETQVEFTEPPKRSRRVTGPHTGGHAKPVTASLDAAMTLVPEGWRWELTTTGFKPGASMIGPVRAALGIGSYAATPALALTAAALRALAQKGIDDGR